MFHVLKGIRGWSNLNITKVDVAKIKNISYHSRLFMLMDREYPYTLYIEYAEPKESLRPIPVHGSNGSVNYIYITQVELTQTITKRYSRVEEVEEEIAQITFKQNELIKLGESLTKRKIE